ncbi:MAG TPA: cytochrome c biogenesis protein CcdA [Bryobacteraceae bacterium]|nr:cytochrome c biogenesis protein CcdA [Bryobacteraceae bacterium]
MKRTALTIAFGWLALGLSPMTAFGQRLDPVQWTLTSDLQHAPAGSSVPLHLKATLQPNWHLYSLTTPKGGPIQTTAGLTENPAIASVKFYQPPPVRKFDPNFQIDTETFEKDVDFPIVAVLAKGAQAGPVELAAQVRYQACNERQCLPPRRKSAAFTLNVDASASAPVGFKVPGGYAEVKTAEVLLAVNSAPAPGSSSVGANDSASVPAAPAASGAGPSPAGPPFGAGAGTGMFLLTAFGLGLASIFTPCVFPMIPITVSFFLNQKGGPHHRGLGQALVFSLGIVVLFCALGLGVTAAVGPFGVNQLGANPWVNGFIALVFGAAALSLLGAFELTLPSGLLTKLDSASRHGGYFGTLLMGLTFALTSFACIGPFMGSLLVATVQSKGLAPVLGMIAFAVGLASPFFLLAAFPSYLKKLPRSGGWLARVKVVMGFVLVAAMIKYLSNVDQVLQLGWITRERFLAAWFVMFTLAGLYLLGLLRLEGVEAGEPLRIGRLMVGSFFLAMACSLLPGMFGASLGQIDAYVPAPSASLLNFNGRNGAGGGQVWLKNQYRQALDQARSENKLVLVTFTGYACTNCHWMKANMFPRPPIAEATKSLVLVELYTDGTDKESEENQKLQDDKFMTVAIPYYALMDPDGNVVATFDKGMTTDTQEFLAFLSTRPAASRAAL